MSLLKREWYVCVRVCVCAPMHACVYVSVSAEEAGEGIKEGRQMLSVRVIPIKRTYATT